MVVIAPVDGPGFGLGAIPSPYDPNDWPIDLLYATLPGDPIDASTTASYRVPGPFPAILNQHTTPECVAFSQAWGKEYEDLKDQGAFNPDEALFFNRIGGTATGAITRNGLKQLQKVGYPVVGDSGAAGVHKIAAYYAVPVTEAAITAAIRNFGVVNVTLPWYNSWFHPFGNGQLPPPDRLAGYHDIEADGWDSRGLEFVQSWGTQYGDSGRAWMPWPYIGHLIEVWKTVDQRQVVAPPSGAHYQMSVAAHAVVQIAEMKGACIGGWTPYKWGPAPSGAPCEAAIKRPGCSSGSAMITLVTAGLFSGKYVRIGAGVSIYKTA